MEGGVAGTRYSILDQINTQNVRQLQVAWTFHTGDLQEEGDPVETTYEVTPLKIDDTVYSVRPMTWFLRLTRRPGAKSGDLMPKIQRPPFQNTQHLTCRGLSYFDGRGKQQKESRSSPIANREYFCRR